LHCDICGRDFKKRKGYTTHLRWHRECRIAWEKQRDAALLLRPRIKCQICGEEFGNISNTHLLNKHQITMADYKHRYGTLFPDTLLSEQNDRREATISKRYTKEEIKYLRGEKSVKSKIKLYGKYPSGWENITEDERARRGAESGKRLREFYKRISADDREALRKKRLSKLISTNVKKYGVEFTQSLPSVREKQRQTLLSRYGVDAVVKIDGIRDRTKQTMFEKYGKYSNFFPHFSLDSQELFREVELLLPNEIECRYATNGSDKANNEFQVLIAESFTRFLDFYIPSLNKWIEYDEEHHKHNYIAKDDKTREKQIRGKICGVELLRVSREEFTNNRTATIQKCVEFILNGRQCPLFKEA
jgi:hypothetical protein